MLEINFKKINNCNYTPVKATSGAAGFDLQANIKDPVVVNKLSRVKIPTGIIIEVPDGYEAQIRPRSGLAANYGLTLTNCVGTIDSDYRGEIIVLIINLGEEDYTIMPDERIAQLVIQKLPVVNFIETTELSLNTNRGSRGFGSTGKINNLHQEEMAGI